MDKCCITRYTIGRKQSGEAALWTALSIPSKTPLRRTWAWRCTTPAIRSATPAHLGPGQPGSLPGALCLGGAGDLHLRGADPRLAEGELFLICPSQVAGYAADREEPWEYCWVGFNGTEAGRLLSLAGFSRETPVLRPPRPEGLKEMLLHIYRSGGNTPAADADMVGYLYLFWPS